MQTAQTPFILTPRFEKLLAQHRQLHGKRPEGTEHFRPFSLERLMRTIFKPSVDVSVAILIDLEDTSEMENYAFLNDPRYSVQTHAFFDIYVALQESVMDKLGISACEMFAINRTYGCNRNFVNDIATDHEGNQLSLESDVFSRFDIILAITDDSATAPLTAFSKQFGFRGATMHGMNSVILASGLAVDYEEVSKTAENLRSALTGADSMELFFECETEQFNLTLMLDGQEAEKSHGLCRTAPNVANLPAGEVYFVPTSDSWGEYPYVHKDGTMSRCHVEEGRVYKASLLKGSQATVDAYNEELKAEPALGELGELGFGTQILPVSGKDIQDEKIFGTFHIATGRSDHLGGSNTPGRFNDPSKATHDDIVYSPWGTPQITSVQVVMRKAGSRYTLIENFEPTDLYRGMRQE